MVAVVWFILIFGAVWFSLSTIRRWRKEDRSEGRGSKAD